MGTIEAPLGSGRARYEPRLGKELIATALQDIERWFEEHPDAYVAISGGKDSTVCLDLARQVNPSVKAAFFDSGIEFPQTLRYIERLQEHWNIDIHVFPADPSALDVMEANGSWSHGVPSLPKDDLHEACIARPLARAQASLGNASIYGLRADESTTRLMMLAKNKGRVTKQGKDGQVEQFYLAPIWRWSFQEVYAYTGNRGIPMNPIYQALKDRGVPERRARVGMLVDGWALDQGRWALARAIAPDLARMVESRLPALAEWR